MPLGSWWGDVLLSVKKEDATGTPGAGDGVEIERAVCCGHGRTQLRNMRGWEN